MSNIEIYVDGGCRGNHSHENREAYGSFAVIYKGETKRIETFDLPGVNTNNEAEYYALFRAMEYINQLRERASSLPEITIKADSELVWKQVQGRYKVKAENLKPLQEIAANWFESQSPTVYYDWVPREEIVAILGH